VATAGKARSEVEGRGGPQHSASVEDRRRRAMSSSTTSPTTPAAIALNTPGEVVRARSRPARRTPMPRSSFLAHPQENRRARERVGSWSFNGIFSGRRAAVRLSVKTSDVTTEESSDLLAAWPHTDPTLRKGSAGVAMIGGMDTEVVQLHTGTVLSLISLK
jgi:hypothetical protein